MDSSRLRVLCVDDSAAVADVVSRLIEAQADLQNVGALPCADGLGTEVARRRPDVIVMDLSMAGTSPLEVIKQLADTAPACAVVAYSGYDDPFTIDTALKAGAAAFVSKHADFSELIDAIHDAADLVLERHPAV